jgi:hypothetical protein
MTDSLTAWIAASRLSMWVTGHLWVWPTLETLHFVGLTLLVGNIGVLDLRMLGLAKQVSIASLSPFVRLGVLGFVINVTTGLLFIAGEPAQYLNNVAFYYKMACVVLAGANVGLFYLSGVGRRTEALEPGADAPVAAKITAVLSLGLWFGVMYFGRMLPYIGNSF